MFSYARTRDKMCWQRKFFGIIIQVRVARFVGAASGLAVARRQRWPPHRDWHQVKFKLPALALQMQQSGRDLKLYRCSVCEQSFASYKNCQQHCSQPHSRCNRGRRPQDFATVIESDIQFRASDRQVGGRMRDVDPSPRPRAHDPCELHYDVQQDNDVPGRESRA